MKAIITGDKEIDKFLKQIEPKLQRKVIRQAQRIGAKVLLASAKAKAPVDTGALKKSIKIKASPKSRRFIGIDIGVGSAWFQGKQFYGAFQEFGTTNIQAKPYISSTYAEYHEKVKNVVMGEMEAGIIRIIEGAA